MTQPLLLRDAELEGRRVDVRADGGVIARISPAGAGNAAGARVLEAGGGALLPGLVDHHVHLFATAAARASVDVSGPRGLAVLRDVPGEGWVRAVGARREMSRTDLDAVVPDRPIRVQHRSGALWTLNVAGVGEVLRTGGAHALTREEQESGQIWRADDRLRSLLPIAQPPDLESLGRELLSRGVTAVTDATPTVGERSLSMLRDALPQRIVSLAGEGDGPRKIVVSDHALPALDELVTTFSEVHRAGRPVAVHSVTRESLVLTAVALREAGPLAGDRIEHAAVCDDDGAALLAGLGVVVVTQPTLVRRRGDDYLAECLPQDRPWLWRHAGLLAAGVPVALSSDAPYGDPDPWRSIAAAVDRTTASGRLLGADERVSPRRALDAVLTPQDDPGGRPRTVHEGAPADLCLLAGPLDVALTDPASTTVAATIIGGEIHFLQPGWACASGPPG